MSSSNIFSIAIVGLGTVGTATIQLLENQLTNINNKSGKQIIIKAISAKNKTKPRNIDLSRYDWEDSPEILTKRKDIDAICLLYTSDAADEEEV